MSEHNHFRANAGEGIAIDFSDDRSNDNTPAPSPFAARANPLKLGHEKPASDAFQLYMEKEVLAIHKQKTDEDLGGPSIKYVEQAVIELPPTNQQSPLEEEKSKHIDPEKPKAQENGNSRDLIAAPISKKPRIDLTFVKTLRPLRSNSPPFPTKDNPREPSPPAEIAAQPKLAPSLPAKPALPTKIKLRPRDPPPCEKQPQLKPTTRESSPVNKDSSEPPEEVVTKYVTLTPMPPLVNPLSKLSDQETKLLEQALQLQPDDPDDGWREDWMGNLGFLHKEVPNPTLSKQKRKLGAATLPFWEWSLGSTSGTASKFLVQLLLKYVYHLTSTPDMAKQILAHAVQYKQDMAGAVDVVARISYDPVVLQEDGWTTKKSAGPQGASGGAYHIGDHVVWQKYEAVVIAYVHDHDMGDLWKAMWLEEYDTFDMEAEELQSGLRKYERKKTSAPPPTVSSRFATASNYSVDNIEHGIVIASTYHPHARHGILWPARVMHVSEVSTSTKPQNKRGSAKNRINVVFLAPYWNGRSSTTPGGGRRVEPYGENLSLAKSLFSSGNLFEMDTIEVSRESLQKYPYSGEQLKIDQLREAFRFLGLPKAAFPRFVDSHRIAMGLKHYASKNLPPLSAATLCDSCAISTLSDTHVLAIQTAMFPSAVLHLPFDFVLSELPPPASDSSPMDQGEETTEPVLQLNNMLDAMKPPNCWSRKVSSYKSATPSREPRNLTPIKSPVTASPSLTKSNGGDETKWTLHDFASAFLIQELNEKAGSGVLLSRLYDELSLLVVRLQQDASKLGGSDSIRRKNNLRSFLNRCMLAKYHGEEFISCSQSREDTNTTKIISEWRKACERIFKRAAMIGSNKPFGNGVTLVITDPRCNEHLNANGCVERKVRLPAALKAARLAGAAASTSIQIISPVEDRFMILAEHTVLPKAHKASYLKRMKARCLAIEPGVKGAPLTDDSDGRGGEDTTGSRGSYTAAVAGVAAALKAVHQIVGGQCVNAFCATRPPGHHAGRDLHPMKAISNGFCMLNPVACAALYATTPHSEGGLGLRRVCVIDFDVHHGNGTQDILCNTYDPRFLYVSMHAGGAHINGYDTEDDDTDQAYRAQRPGGSSQNAGIFPGRCGDTSPHDGVLNIPLGAKVTSHDVGSVLVSKVSPAVDAFSPDLIILSAGFDAHKNDPLGMGGLSAQDFGSITTVACSMAFRSCSGRILSVMEGGYGVPCCRPQSDDLFLPPSLSQPVQLQSQSSDNSSQHLSQSQIPNVPPHDQILEEHTYTQSMSSSGMSVMAAVEQQRQEVRGPQLKLLDLGEDLPDDMEDEVPRGLRGKVDRCHTEGFLDCVREHISALGKCNTRK